MNPISPDQALGAVVGFLRDLWALDHGLRSVSKALQSKIGVTGAQRAVLLLVASLPRPSATDLAQHLSIHRSTLAGILRRLEGRGLIVRHSDPDDGRRVLFEPSDKGRAVLSPKEHTIEGAVRSTINRLPEEKIQAAREVLSELSTELSRIPR